MGSPGNLEPSAEEPIRFDRAEYTNARPRAVDCTACNQRIGDVYYEVNGEVLCDRCIKSDESVFPRGSGFFRFMRAGAFGVAAAIGGTILIYLFRELTGWEAGVISILAGFMVGSAVKQGSGYRGGRVY